MNPPFHLIEAALEHYLALKAKTPDSTSACILVPRWPGARWNRLLQGMTVLTSFKTGEPLFEMIRPGTENRATPAIPWPVDIYYDAPYEPHQLKITKSGEQTAQQTPAMHFRAAVSGTPAVVALDSQATHCFIDKQFAHDAGVICTPAHRMVQLADGSHTQITAECKVHLKIFSDERGSKAYVGKVPCFLIDLGEDHNIILGQDWLQQEEAVMTFKTNSCQLMKRGGLLLTHNSHSEEQEKHIRPTLSAARTLKAVANGCALLHIQLQAMPGPPPEGPKNAGIPEQVELPEGISTQVRHILQKHAAVFGKREGLPPDRGTFLTIPEMPGATPQFKHPYRLSPKEVQEVQTQVKELLRQGLIEPSNSPYGAPILFVQKKDGTLRMCCDWRKLNAQTIKSRYPLPRIDELMDSLQGAQFFTSLDLQSGYHQILISPEDAPKTAFTTPFGHYQWKVMSFGLCNAPAIFQETMNKVLSPLLRKGVLVYMDDIMVYAKTREEHARLLDQALTLLREHDFYVKLSKCEFEKPELKFLGHIVGKEGIKVDPAKTQVVRDWPTPTSVKDVRSFLGLANYFRKFVQGYSTLVEPLTRLTRKELVWNNQTWDSKCEQAFQGVKSALTNAPVLIMPDQAKGDYEVICDASLVGIGAVLTQGGKPIAYESSKFSAAERNWSTTEQELWAVVHALQTWRCYLEGVPFKVITDHNPLTHLPKQATLTRKQARWSQYLQQFDFTWEYRPGRTNVADPLSRIPNLKGIALNAVTLKNLTERVTRSKTGAKRQPEHRDVPEGENHPPKRRRKQKGKEERPVAAPALEVAQPTTAEQPAIDLLTQVQRGYLLDEWFTQEQNLKSADLHQRDGLWLTRDGQVAVPDVHGLRRGIIYDHHDTPVAGHPGGEKTLRAVKSLYWWPKMEAEIKAYVHTCASCQRNKPVNKKPNGKLHPLPIPGDKWESVSMDFITQLPKTKGPIQYDAIVVFVDRLSKMVRIAPTTSDVTAEGTAQLVLDHVFRHYGMPKTLITDRGSTFTSKMFEAFTKAMGTQHKLSVSFHPQTDGQTERTNQTLETMLRHYVGGIAHGDWDNCLTAAEFAINNAYTPAIGTTPFLLNYGRQPRLPGSITPARVPKPQEWADRMIYGLAEAKRHLRLAQERMKKQYDKGRTDIEFQVGQLVLLSSKNITLRRVGDRNATPKLMPKWIGPFPIEEVIGKGAYRLTLPPHMKAHNVFNVVSLRPFHSDGRKQPPPPILVDGEEEFQVHSLADHRAAGRSFEYLVRWQGYGPEYNTWEPQKNLEDNEAFELYWQQKGLEPPVHAKSIQAIKARTAKVVHEKQQVSFPRTLRDMEVPCWKPTRVGAGSLALEVGPGRLVSIDTRHEPHSSTDSLLPL
jgi:transposase InsO family protein